MADFRVPESSFSVPAAAFETGKPKASAGAKFDALGLEETLARLQESVIEADIEESFSLAKQSAYRLRSGIRRVSLGELLPDLPPPGTEVYILANGIGGRRMPTAHPDNWGAQATFARGVDFGAFLPHLVDLVAPGGMVNLHIATWSVDNVSAVQLVDLLDAGRVGHLVLCVSRNFHSVRPEVAYWLLRALQARGQTYLAFRTHAKVICVAAVDGEQRATVTGSANFSSQPRVEQFVVSTAPAVHDFFVEHLFEWALAQRGA